MAIKYADGRMHHYPDELQLSLEALAEIEEGME